jgi:hypothetical protein
MKPGDKIPMRVNRGEWLEATVLLVTKADLPGAVVVDEGIPAPFTLFGDKQSVAVMWRDGLAGDLFVKDRTIGFQLADGRIIGEAPENS